MMGIANETSWRKFNGVRTVLPHDPLVRHHAWSRDPARDRAVRLAEDGVAERKTLEEAIAGVFEHKGESMDELRTERVVLEIRTPIDRRPASAWFWHDILSGLASGFRVVPDAEIDASWRAACESARLASSAIDDDKGESMGDEEKESVDRVCREEGYRILMAEMLTARNERDAAIREQEEWRRSWILSEESGTRLLAERNAARDDADGLRARVAAPAAEAVAWGVNSPNGYRSLYSNARHAKDRAKEVGGTVVTLFTAPPPAKGWLTEEEREAVVVMALAMERDAEYAEKCDEPDHASAARNRAGVLRALLARNAPPPAKGWLTPAEQRMLAGMLIQQTDIAIDNEAAGNDSSAQRFRATAKIIEGLLARNEPPMVKLPPAVHKDIIAALAAAGVEVESQS
jgi:hypothetical protein